MKDEMNSAIMTEFVGLRAKMYLLQYGEEEMTMKKAKGVKKYVANQNMSHDDYRDCLFDSTEYLHAMNSIRSQKHVLYSIRQNKKTLSAYDDKRYMLDDGITTIPYVQYSL